MSLRAYTWVWFAIVLLLSYEYLMLNGPQPEEGFLGLAKTFWPGVREFNLSPEPGRPLSLLLGWSGIGLMVLTNFYVLRKRLGWFKSWGKAGGWLDFHILCGLLGPTLIVFHTNFKVRGLVSISFWSMIIVFLSGVVGRYFYIQLLRSRAELDAEAQAADQELRAIAQHSGGAAEAGWVDGLQQVALQRSGAAMLVDRSGLLLALLATLIGDLRLAIQGLPRDPRLPGRSRLVLKRWALAKRRGSFFDEFQSIMGYWHAFHLPFAVFMYVVAVIHIATALLFGVSR